MKPLYIYIIIQLILIQSLIQGQSTVVLTHTSPETVVSVQGCSGSPCNSMCGTTPLIYGGYMLFGTGAKLVFSFSNLPYNYYSLQIVVGFFKIDSWNNEKVIFTLDTNPILDQAYAMTDGTDICGQDECTLGPSPYCNKDKLDVFTMTQNPYSSKSFQFQISTQLDQDPSDESWGITQISFTLNLCHSWCTICSGPSNLQCTGCATGYYLYLNSQCLDVCPTLYFANTGNGKCDQCHSSCLTCTSSASDKCLSCAAPLFLYNQSSTVRTCVSQCPTTALWGDSITRTCGSTCPTGYYKDVAGGKQLCQLCATGCTTCSGSSTNCQSCSAGYYLDGSKCVLSCGTGKYSQTSPIWKCLACDASCKECTDSAPTSCTQCALPLYLMGSQCKSACDSHYYNTSSPNPICLPCDSSTCDECINTSTFCTKCVDPTHYINNITGVCSTDCPSNLYSHVNTAGVKVCLTNCPYFYYYNDNATMSCLTCHVSCLACAGPTDQECQYCKSAYGYLYVTDLVNQAGPCINDCADVGKLNQPGYQQCVDACYPGYYQVGSNCVSCPYPCYECTGPDTLTQCLSCSTPLYYKDNTCHTDCTTFSQFYAYNVTSLVGYGNECKPCYSSCQECVDGASQSCLKCVSGKNLVPAVNKCYETGYDNCTYVGECVTNCPSANLIYHDTKYSFPIDICLDKCPPGTYENHLVTPIVCSPCDTSCLECDGPSPQNCTKCAGISSTGVVISFLENKSCLPSCYPVGQFGQVGGQNECVDTCSDGYQANITNNINICTVCPVNCLTCDWENDCKTCNTTFYLLLDTNSIGSCVANCGTDRYPDPVTQTCTSCDPSCLLCNSTGPTACTKCDSTNLTAKYYQAGKCVAACDDGYYLGTVTLPGSLGTDTGCAKCDSACTKCTGPDKNTQCTECATGYFSYPNQCKNTCPSGYYGNTANNKCESCDTTCAECNGAGPSKCTKCLLTRYKLGTTCVENCDPGTYKKADATNGNTCSACNSNCLTCSTSSTTCTSCNQSTTNIFLDGTTCKSTCPNGKYGDPPSQTCKTCDTTCKTCQYPGTSNDCLSCNTGRYLYLTQCVTNCSLQDSSLYSHLDIQKCQTSCQTGYYKDETTKECKKCDSACVTCFGAGPTLCYTCAAGYFFNASATTCQTTCADGFYQDSVNRLCAQCDPVCVTCVDSPNKCIKCSSGLYVQAGNCYASCPFPFYNYEPTYTCVERCPSIGFYPAGNWVQAIWRIDCYVCQNECRTCLGIDNCTSCKTVSGVNYYLINAQCKMQCPDDGFWDDNTELKCKSCDPTCLTCSGSSSNNCLTCNQTGTNPLFYLNQCLVTCINGTFRDNFNCTPCNSQCATCTGPSSTECTSCNSTTYLLTNTCVTDCGQLYFKNLTTNRCDACDYRCQQCTGPLNTQCPQCASGYLVNAANECVATCPSNKYSNTTHCKPCQANCTTCYGPTNLTCYSCSASTYFLTNQCLAACPISYYYQYNPTLSHNECLSCSSNCAQCLNNLVCQVCLSPFVLYNNVCLSDCPQSYFNSSGVCQPCNSNCKNCLGSAANQCTECFYTELGAKYYQHQCYLTCPSRTFEDTRNCTNCHPYCRECSGGSTDHNCTQCELSRYLQDSQCLTDCFEGFYEDVSTQECEACNYRCKSCYEKTNLECYECVAPYVQHEIFKCLDACPDGYYNASGVCQQCDSKCRLCYGGSAAKCTSCNSGSKLFENHECLTSCPDGYFVLHDATILSDTCQTCSTGCLSCTNEQQDQCLSCFSDYVYLDNSFCLTECPTYHYNDSGICRDCDPSCMYCSSSAPDHCTRCEQPLKYYLNQCLADCFSNQYFEQDPTGQLNCLFCNERCSTCSGPLYSECFTCSESFYLINTSYCIDSCPETKYFQNEQNNSCDSCSQYCLTCRGSLETDCLTCIDGYELDPETGACLKIQCHYSCALCTGSSYDSCLECAGNRGVPGTNGSPKNGVCECPEGSLDTLEAECEEDNIFAGLAEKSGNIVMFANFGMAFLFVLNRNRLLLYQLLESCQVMSFMLYINSKLSANINQILRIYYYANFASAIPNPFKGEESARRILTLASEGTSERSQSYLPETKFQLMDKQSKFLENGGMIVILHVIGWIFVLLCRQHLRKFYERLVRMQNGLPLDTEDYEKRKEVQLTPLQIAQLTQKEFDELMREISKDDSNLTKICKLVDMSLALQIFLRTMLESSLFIVLQIYYVDLNGTTGQISFAVCLLFLAYKISLIYRFYRILNTPLIRNDLIIRQRYGSLFYELDLGHSKAAEQQQTQSRAVVEGKKEEPPAKEDYPRKQGTGKSRRRKRLVKNSAANEDQKTKDVKELEGVREEKDLRELKPANTPYLLRNYPFILMIRKPLIALIYVTLYSQRAYCATLLFLVSLAYFSYTLRHNPFKTRFERIINMSIEAQLLLVYSIQWIQQILEPDNSNSLQKNISYIMLIDLIVYLIGFLVVMTVYFFLALKDLPCYRWLCQSKRQVQPSQQQSQQENDKDGTPEEHEVVKLQKRTKKSVKYTLNNDTLDQTLDHKELSLNNSLSRQGLNQPNPLSLDNSVVGSTAILHNQIETYKNKNESPEKQTNQEINKFPKRKHPKMQIVKLIGAEEPENQTIENTQPNNTIMNTITNTIEDYKIGTIEQESIQSYEQLDSQQPIYNESSKKNRNKLTLQKRTKHKNIVQQQQLDLLSNNPSIVTTDNQPEDSQIITPVENNTQQDANNIITGEQDLNQGKILYPRAYQPSSINLGLKAIADEETIQDVKIDQQLVKEIINKFSLDDPLGSRSTDLQQSTQNLSDQQPTSPEQQEEQDNQYDRIEVVRRRKNIRKLMKINEQIPEEQLEDESQQSHRNSIAQLEPILQEKLIQQDESNERVTHQHSDHEEESNTQQPNTIKTLIENQSDINQSSSPHLILDEDNSSP